MFVLNIKQLRTAKGLSQEELANLSDCSQMYISLLERNNRTKSPTLRTLEQIMKALDVECPVDICKFECDKYDNCKKELKKHFFCVKKIEK